MSDIERAKDILLDTDLYCVGYSTSELRNACDLAISALEKQIPKKPLDIKMLFVPHSTLIKSVYGKCPICDTVQADDEYCQHCGQKLDWSVEE